MPHFFVDDAFHDSKEVMSIPARSRNAAIGLWTRCGAWSAANLTDGLIPADVLRAHAGRSAHALVEHLVESTLWEREEGGAVRFRNWSKWQRTARQVRVYREKQAEKKRQQRAEATPKLHRNCTETAPKVSPKCKSDNAETVTKVSAGDALTSEDDGLSPGDTLGDKKSCPPGIPQTPIPIPISTSTYVGNHVALVGGSGGKGQTAARGTRLPNGWMPDPAVVAQMRSDHPHVDLKAEHAKFTDYFRAQPGAKGRKADWNAAWRNWVRRAAEQNPRALNRRPPASDAAFAATQALKTAPTSRLELPQ